MFGGGSIQLVRVLGIRIGVSPSWFIVLFLVIYLLSGYFGDVLGGSQTTGFLVAVASALLFFCSLVLHELGHALVARRRGIEIAGIDLWLLGGIAKMRRDTRSPGEEFAVAVAGPVVSLLLAVLFAVLSVAVAGGTSVMDVATFSTSAEVTPALALCIFVAEMNVWLFAFNLLPAFPLDGGRLARAAVWKLTGDRNRATRASGRIGQAAGYALIALGLWRVASGDGVDGLWWAVVGWFISSAARSAVVGTAFTERLDGITVADVMDASPVAVPAATTSGRAQDEFFLRYRWDWFPVVDEAGRFAGLLRRERVDAEVAAGRAGVAIRDVLDGDAADWRVGAEEPLEALLGSERLRRLGALMAVDADGVLRGVITFDQVRRAVTAALPSG